MTSYPDSMLIELVIANDDQRAFAELVKRNQSSIRHSLRQLTNWNEALADDLAQETFIQAYQSLHRFKHKAQFSSWLYRIAYNQFLQYCRRAQSQKNYAEFEPLDDIDEQKVCNDHNIEQKQDEHDHLQKKVAQLLSELKPERRSVLHLLLHRQYTQQEIAITMGIPLGTVKTHISRGRADLATKLANWQA